MSINAINFSEWQFDNEEYIHRHAGGHGRMHREPAYFYELCARPFFHNATRKVMVRNLITCRFLDALAALCLPLLTEWQKDKDNCEVRAASHSCNLCWYFFFYIDKYPSFGFETPPPVLGVSPWRNTWKGIMKNITFPILRRQVDMKVCVRLRIWKGKKIEKFEEEESVHCESNVSLPLVFLSGPCNELVKLLQSS